MNDRAHAAFKKKGARGYDSEYYTGIFVALETPALNQFNKI
jgi:hypothetical protein